MQTRNTQIRPQLAFFINLQRAVTGTAHLRILIWILTVSTVTSVPLGTQLA